MGAGIGKSQAPLMYKRLWERARGFQGDEVASIERYTETGGDDAAGIAPTRTLVTGLSDLAVVVDDFTEQIAKALGEEWNAGNKVFRFMPNTDAKKVLDSDFILWTKQGETTQTRWKPDSVQMQNWATDWSSCIAIAHREARP